MTDAKKVSARTITYIVLVAIPVTWLLVKLYYAIEFFVQLFGRDVPQPIEHLFVAIAEVIAKPVPQLATDALDD